MQGRSYIPTNPDGISYAPNLSDPARQWCLTLAAPLATFMVDGKMWGHTHSAPPPKSLIGRRIAFHGGQGLVKIKPLKEEVAVHKAIQVQTGFEEDAWRAGLDAILKRTAGQLVGSGVLRGAYILSNMIGEAGAARCASAWRPDSLGGKYLGDWFIFSGKTTLVAGDWSAPDARAKKRRWVWCFDDMRRGFEDLRTPAAGFRGFGGIWDLRRGLAHRISEQTTGKESSST